MTTNDIYEKFKQNNIETLFCPNCKKHRFFAVHENILDECIFKNIKLENVKRFDAYCIVCFNKIDCELIDEENRIEKVLAFINENIEDYERMKKDILESDNEITDKQAENIATNLILIGYRNFTGDTI